MSAVWGVSSYEGPAGERFSYRVGTDEMNRDIGSATERLGALGVGDGDRVLVCSRLCEAAQWWPFTIAPMLVGAQVSLADSKAGDAPRIAMFCRELDYRAVLGVNEAVVSGLRAIGAEPVEVFGSVGVVGITPAAAPALQEARCELRPMTTLGPAVAIADGPAEPLRVVASEWSLGSQRGHITLSALAPRLEQFHRVCTAVRGEEVGPAAFRAAAAEDRAPSKEPTG